MIRLLLIFASLIMIVGGYAVRYLDHAVNAPKAAAVATTQDNAPRAPVHSGRTLTLEANRQGHFQVEARVEGRPIDFMVDTGASLVTLRESDAARVGIRPMRSDYTAVVHTANGSIKAARAKLDRVALGGITVYDVPALVLPDEVLGQNLLGVSFLSRLKRYEYANGRLLLEE